MEAKAPWTKTENNPPQQVVVGSMRPQQFIAGQPSEGQNILYVGTPKFNPETNFRHISYMVIASAIGVFFLFVLLLQEEDMGCGLCCGIFGVGLMFDAAYYSGRSTWQSQHGESTSGSTIGLIGDLLLALACLAIAFFILADELLGF